MAVKVKKPWYKRWWAITLFVFIGLSIIGSFLDNSEPQTQQEIEQPRTVQTSATPKQTNIPSEPEAPAQVAKAAEPVKVCKPREKKCDGDTLRECNSEGTIWKKVKDCDTCQDSICTVYGEKPSLTDSLREAQQGLQALQKVDQCSAICAGDEANIPAFKDKWYSACFQIYYATGEAGLDEFVQDCKK